MPRSNAYDKGRRYLAEGRLIVTRLDERTIEGRVRGTSAVHHVSYDGEWIRSCRGLTFCSHLYALMLVTAHEKAGLPHAPDRAA